MSPSTQAILASLLSSLLGLAGGFILLANRTWISAVSRYLVSFAAGTLLAAAFFDLLPEAIEHGTMPVTTIFGWLLGGFALFLIIEKFLLWHHHTHGDPAAETEHHRKSLIPLIIAGDAIHNFIDGAVIAAAFLVNPALGVTTAVAVLVHELPQEVGDFAILVHGGMRRKSIVLWNMLGALISPLGAAAVLLAAGGFEGIEVPLLGLAAGMFIYIASVDLVPELRPQKRIRATLAQLGLMLAGVLAILWVGSVAPHAHGHESEKEVSSEAHRGEHEHQPGDLE